MMEDFTKLPLDELRQIWAETWNMPPTKRIGRIMMEKSLVFKKQNNLTREQEAQLEQLIKKYKHNPAYFESSKLLKPGTRLIRNWKGKRHSILVKAGNFEYQDRIYTSLSQIANEITGSRWNGHIFFGVKKGGKP